MSFRPRKHLFNLPNGASLKFAPHWKIGRQSDWYYSFNDQRVWEAGDKGKGKQYLLNLWSSRTDLSVVAADYDELPFGFHDWDRFAEYMSMVFSPSQAIVCRSSSNKVKVFFLVEENSHE